MSNDRLWEPDRIVYITDELTNIVLTTEAMNAVVEMLPVSK